MLPISWVSEVGALGQGGWRAQGLAQHEKMEVLHNVPLSLELAGNRSSPL